MFVLPQHLNSRRPTAQHHHNLSASKRLAASKAKLPTANQATNAPPSSLQAMGTSLILHLSFLQNHTASSRTRITNVMHCSSPGRSLLMCDNQGCFQLNRAPRTTLQGSTDPFLLTLYLFGEFYPMRISQRSWLFINVVNVKNFTHKLNHRLCFVEGSGRN